MHARDSIGSHPSSQALIEVRQTEILLCFASSSPLHGALQKLHEHFGGGGIGSGRRHGTVDAMPAAFFHLLLLSLSIELQQFDSSPVHQKPFRTLESNLIFASSIVLHGYPSNTCPSVK
ncbi:hypothetical protein [Oryza sativa Japonica Group]|uniref:Uncharacterized protein n=1 Tax=Oryza sativa subsp. japonica TaxID=39947 RepID=Q657T3_ORYSJ|nr:hypothetical protein [Oryza sativa Japonica Group]